MILRRSIRCCAFACVGTALMASSVAAQPRTVQSFEQLRVLVGPTDRISIREGVGEEVSAQIIDLTSTELVVMVDGQRRAFHSDDVMRIRQRRSDSLGNGAWIGFAAGAGLALVGIAAEPDLFDNAGWALLAIGLYGSMGAGVGVGVDALIRGRQVIYQHPSGAAPALALVPVVSTRRVGAMLALRF